MKTSETKREYDRAYSKIYYRGFYAAKKKFTNQRIGQAHYARGYRDGLRAAKQQLVQSDSPRGFGWSGTANTLRSIITVGDMIDAQRNARAVS